MYFTVSSNIISTFCFCQMYRINHMFLSLNCIFEVKKIFFHLNTMSLGTDHLTCKNSESDYYFFLSPKSEYFFSNIGNHNFFLEKNSLSPPRVSGVHISNQENECPCICVLEESILPLSTILLLDFETVQTVWYFRTVQTVWYFRTV